MRRTYEYKGVLAREFDNGFVSISRGNELVEATQSIPVAVRAFMAAVKEST